MKKIYIFFVLFVMANWSFSQSTYNANGASGFGGAIGQSTLSISETGSTINFTLTRGAGNFNDAFTIYIDSKAGGASSTAGYTDVADYLRRSISGLNGSGRSTINFPSSPSAFLPDYAISMTPSGAGGTNFAGVWDLSTPTNFTFGVSANLSPNNSTTATTYTFSIDKSAIGISGAVNFNFIGTYGNPDGGSGYFRSNEGYGNGLPAGNPGVSTVTYTSFLTYPLVSTPLILRSFTGSIKDESAKIDWSTLTEFDLNKFILQKSVNGLNFVDIANITAKNISTGANYTYTDNSLNNGNNFYRLVSVDNSGKSLYSKIVRLQFGRIDNTLALFPNPTREILKINFMSAIKGNYVLSIFNDAGQKLLSKDIEHDGIGKILDFHLPANMKKGPYRVYISNQYEFYKGTFIVQ
jgi:hypothetical protein